MDQTLIENRQLNLLFDQMLLDRLSGSNNNNNNNNNNNSNNNLFNYDNEYSSKVNNHNCKDNTDWEGNLPQLLLLLLLLFIYQSIIKIIIIIIIIII